MNELTLLFASCVKSKDALLVQKDRPGTPSQSSGEVEGGGELKKEAEDGGPAHTKRARSGSEPEVLRS